MIKGSCLCGGVGYEFTEFSQPPTHCHCNMCQKISGAAFGTYGRPAQDTFRVSRGASLIREYAASEDFVRSFCSECGSTLFFAPKNGDHISVSLGTVDGDPGIAPAKHIFIESKATWFDPDDDLPKIEGYGK